MVSNMTNHKISDAILTLLCTKVSDNIPSKIQCLSSLAYTSVLSLNISLMTSHKMTLVNNKQQKMVPRTSLGSKKSNLH